MGNPLCGSVDILGVSIDCLDFAATLNQIQAWIEERSASGFTAGCRQICTVNPEFIVDAYRDPRFAATLARADLRVPDGIGVLWAARLAGVRLQERVTGSDGVFRIAERGAACGWRVFFLGAAPGIAATTATRLRERYPGLIVAGAYGGSPADDDWAAIQGWLAATRPDILLVAYGHPAQDYWIDHHRRELPVAVAIGVGGAFDFVSGVAQRAPRWLRRLGLEWLHRLWREPWRWRRMLKLPIFVVYVLTERAGLLRSN